MADIIAMFSRWAKSELAAMFSQDVSSSLDGSPSSSMEPIRRSAYDDFQRIIRMLPRIEAVLEDAEERDIQDRSVNLWLSELRLLAYDIDDVVDEYEYDVLRAQIEATAAEEAYHRVKRKQGDDDHHDEDEWGEGRNILASSSSSQVPAISDGMAEKIREIRERFDEIEKDRKALRLREEDGARRSVAAYRPRPTSSLVDESSIIGRQSDKEKIVELLRSDLESGSNIQVNNKIAVIAIVGMGGVGKTTLAQLIYNDPKIHQHFDLRIWIHVSEDFDLMRITKEIYRSITKKPCKEDDGFDYLQDSIKKYLMKWQKRMFLVLDDVWNEEQHLWVSLQAPLHGADTVKILMTTRNRKVADVMRTMNSFHLGFLSEEEGWQLLKQHAFNNENHDYDVHKNLMNIGKRIVNKCGGLPLAIKLLGSHLRFERDEDKWMNILESELWELDLGANEILPALKLSYQRMPTHLKPCFRYCSMFPKNEMLEKNRLVWLWMAQGYIQPKPAGKTIEETGREYFDELLGRSFLQIAEFKENTFIMHDLIFDLAVYISGKEFTTIKLEGGKQNKCISNNVRHLVIHDHLANNEALEGNLVHPFLSGHATLRSVFYYGYRIINDFQLPDSKCLRAVHIKVHKYEPSTFQFLDSIVSLKHLRYLCLSDGGFADIQLDFREYKLCRGLFNSFHSIYNLQVLDLYGYFEPIMLPASIKNLINLRHLVLPRGSFMPCGISKLAGLQTLKCVTVENGSHECGRIGEIEDLASLTGSCLIHGICHINDVEGVKKINLNKKKYIRRLCLSWHSFYGRSFDVDINFSYIKQEQESSQLENVVLKGLRPHNGLRGLEIINYPGPSFDVDINFSYIKQEQESSQLEKVVLKALQPHNELRELEIINYTGVQLPLWLGDLPCLQSIYIGHCNKLKNIEIAQLFWLRSLLVQECPKLTTLHGLCSLHQLEKLKISRCYNLSISAKEKLPSKLQSVWFEDCWKLASLTGLQNLHSLKELKLKTCSKLQLSLDEQLSTMPGVFEVINCPRLEVWYQIYRFEVIQHVSKLKKLTIHLIDEITSDYGKGNLVSLETLHIFYCYNREFPEDEWIPCSLHTLHLNSCPDLKFFPPYQNLSALRLLKIWHCKALTYLSGLQMMKSLERLEIIDCPQFTLSPVQRFPSKLKFLLISNCPSLLWLPGLQQLFYFRDLKLYGCLQLMLPPLEQLPFMLHVQFEIFNCPKLREWCRIYNLGYNNKESPKALFARSSQEIKSWQEEEASVLLENICVLDYDEAILETEEWLALRILGFYICSCARLKSITFGHNFIRLKQLRIWNCSHLNKLDGLCNLTSLQDMDINKCPNLDSLNIPTSLQSLAIDRCNNLWSLSCRKAASSSVRRSLYCRRASSSLSFRFKVKPTIRRTSLRFLKISKCPKLFLVDESLPDAAPYVEIRACPKLQEWCQKHHIAYFLD